MRNNMFFDKYILNNYNFILKKKFMTKKHLFNFNFIFFIYNIIIII